ncbi:hypothetical protein [Novosphingobium colocasiae]|uniref:hypothetical protein n=1 Tax=Novosphingobium colocasiae TaxID=1256513 RepID=UPI0035B2B627
MPSSPRVASVPLVVIQREIVGYTLQTWKAPEQGWTPLDELQRFPNFSDAVMAQTWRVAREGGAIVSLLDLPNQTLPHFGGQSNG